MRKTLLSMAFVAASGIYVTVANSLFGGSAEIGTDAAAAPAAATTDDQTAQGAGSEPAASAPQSVQPIAGKARPPTEVPEQAAPTPHPGRTEVASASSVTTAPPLPRPRPKPPALLRRGVAAAPAAPVVASGYRDGIFTGTDEDAYYGRVQVQLTIAAQHIVGVRILDYPRDRRTSRFINSQAIPVLKQETIAATSAKIDMVSGATLTSRAYIRSLRNALGQANANA